MQQFVVDVVVPQTQDDSAFVIPVNVIPPMENQIDISLNDLVYDDAQKEISLFLQTRNEKGVVFPRTSSAKNEIAHSRKFFTEIEPPHFEEERQRKLEEQRKQNLERDQIKNELVSVQFKENVLSQENQNILISDNHPNIQACKNIQKSDYQQKSYGNHDGVKSYLITQLGTQSLSNIGRAKKGFIKKEQQFSSSHKANSKSTKFEIKNVHFENSNVLIDQSKIRAMAQQEAEQIINSLQKEKFKERDYNSTGATSPTDVNSQNSQAEKLREILQQELINLLGSFKKTQNNIITNKVAQGSQSNIQRQSSGSNASSAPSQTSIQLPINSQIGNEKNKSESKQMELFNQQVKNNAKEEESQRNLKEETVLQKNNNKKYPRSSILIGDNEKESKFLNTIGKVQQLTQFTAGILKGKQFDTVIENKLPSGIKSKQEIPISNNENQQVIIGTTENKKFEITASQEISKKKGVLKNAMNIDISQSSFNLEEGNKAQGRNQTTQSKDSSFNRKNEITQSLPQNLKILSDGSAQSSLRKVTMPINISGSVDQKQIPNVKAHQTLQSSQFQLREQQQQIEQQQLAHQQQLEYLSQQKHLSLQQQQINKIFSQDDPNSQKYFLQFQHKFSPSVQEDQRMRQHSSNLVSPSSFTLSTGFASNSKGSEGSSKSLQKHRQLIPSHNASSSTQMVQMQSSTSYPVNYQQMIMNPPKNQLKQEQLFTQQQQQYKLSYAQLQPTPQRYGFNTPNIRATPFNTN